MPRTVVLAGVAAIIPALGFAAAPARGLSHERTIYADSVDVPLRTPEGVACDDHGAVVIADTGNARLLTFTWRDGSLDGGAQVRLSQMIHPVRVQIDSKGLVLVLDRRWRRILKVDTAGAFAGYLDPQGASGPVAVASFKLDSADVAYLLDVVAGKVLVVGPDARVVREVLLPKGARGITDVAVDQAGKIYVVDAPTAVVFVAEPGDAQFKPLSASLKEMISFPGYLTSDNRGKLYVVDQSGGAIVRLGNDGSFQGRDLAVGWMDGALNYPGQLCLTAGGEVIVADRANNRVQIFATAR